MKGRFVTITIFAILLGAGIFFFQFWNPSQPSISPLKAIPLNTAILVKVNGVLPLLSQLENNSLFQNTDNQDLKSNVEKLKSQLDSLSHEYSFLSDVFNDSSIYFAVTYSNSGSIGYMFFANFQTNIKLEKIEVHFASLFSLFGQSCTRYGTNDQSISKNQWFYYLDKGLFVIGNDFKDIDGSHHQLRRNVSLLDDTAFSRLSVTTGKNVIANVYINTGVIKKISKDFVQQDKVQDIENTFSANGWVALDINIDNEFIGYQGFSNGKASKSIWSKLLKIEQPAENQFYNFIPSNTVYYNSFTFSDPFNFSLALKDKMKRERKFSDYIKSIREEFDCEVDLKITEILGDAVLLLLVKDENEEFDKYCVIKTSDPTEARDWVIKMKEKQKDTGKKKNSKKSKNNPGNESKEDTTNLNLIYYSRLPNGDLPVLLFGSSFDGFNYQYACNYKECIILGSSEEGLKQLVNQLTKGQLLVNDSVFKQSCINLFSSRNNATGYLNVKNAWSYLSNFLLPEFSKKIENLFVTGAGQPLIGFQFSGNGDLTYNNGFLYCKIQEPSDTRLRWSLEVDTTTDKIFELDYKISRHKAILVQDKAGTIYYVTLKGEIKWQRNIDGEILGQPYPIKYFKDKGQCLVFNTKEYLYIIDNEGVDVEGYPIKFKNNATIGLTVADFDNDRNYRFYLAFENKSVVALDKTGSKIDGWQFDKTAEIVSFPVICYSYDKKDYVIFCDNQSIYILNRKGAQRIEVRDDDRLKNIVSMSIDSKTRYFRIITVNNEYNIMAVYPDGHVERVDINKPSVNGFLTTADIEGNKENDYIICDSTVISVRNYKNEQYFSTTLPVTITEPPIIAKNFKDEHLILVENADSRGIYLINSEGMVLKDSPLNGNSPIIFISLTDLNQSSGLICSDNNQLLYYSIR